MKILDLESHFYSMDLIENYKKRSSFPYIKDSVIHYTEDFYVPFVPSLLMSPEEHAVERIRVMDQCGVSAQALGVSQGIEFLSAEEGIALARKTNDMVYTLTQSYPGRFYGFASLPTQDIDAAIDELKRCVNELGFIGWMTFSNYGSGYLDDERCLPLLKAAEELNAVVYLHPSAPFIDRLNGLGHALAGGALGFTVDTTITIVRMIMKGVFDMYPELQVVLGHLGEGIPFYLDRLDKRAAAQDAIVSRNEQLPSTYFKRNISVTSSGVYSQEAFSCARDVLGMDRIMFGSDYPYETLSSAVEYVQSLPVSMADRAKICGENAKRIFKLLNF